MLPLSPRICQCTRQFFVKKPKLLAATSNLRVEQYLVHLGRFLRFSQKVVGVALNKNLMTCQAEITFLCIVFFVQLEPSLGIPYNFKYKEETHVGC